MTKVGYITYKKEPAAKICDQCGGAFLSYAHNALRCSKSCQNKYRAAFEKNKRKHEPKKARTISCSTCKMTITLPKGSLVSNLCCSEKCRKESDKKRQKKQVENGNIAKSQKKYNATEKSKEKSRRFYRGDKYKTWIEKKKKDPEYRLYQVIRATLGRRIKSNKRLKTSIYCDYTPKELRNHLQEKFQKGMSWDNYGVHGWHIDHIRPISSFVFFDKNGDTIDEEVKQCMRLENLQPLWAKDNIRKSNNY